MRRTLLCTLTWLAMLVAGAEARCTQTADLNAVGSAIRLDVRCRFDQLTNGGPTCPPPGAPSCAGDMPERVADLLTGGEPGPVPGWTSEARRCQRYISSAGARFVQRRLRERALGRRAARSGHSMRLIARRTCNQMQMEENGLGDPLVRVGAPCSSLLGSAGETIDGKRLARCLRAALEAEVDDIAPSPLAPNIVLILTDDQRFDTFDVMPATSALRDEGISFSNAFVTNPLCTPSRASILTGRYSHTTGVLSNGDYANLDDSDTIATWLADAGYTNGLFGKYVNQAVFLGATPPQGWHEWKSFLDLSGGAFNNFEINDNGVFKTINNYSTDWLGSEVVHFIRANSARPFFAAFTPFAPHSPSTPAKRHEGELVGYPLYRPPSWFDDVTDKPTWVNYYRAIAGPNKADVIDANREDQLRTLLAVDEAVEKILARLERLGLTDNTIVIFTSDHGFLWGEHWLQGKFNPYEESIRVPYVVRYPRRYPVPGVRDQMVLNQDIAPTLAALAGATAPPDLDGVSLIPVLDSAAAPGREEFLIETLGEFITRPSQSVRTEDWKYIDTMASGGVTQELYDLSADPFEQNNLAADPGHAAVLADMVARLDALRP